MKEIILVEDDLSLNKLLSAYLTKESYIVHSCSCINDTRQYLNNQSYLWIVDVMLPDGNGLELLKDIKEVQANSFVIIISAKGDRFDRVTGFEFGCDDYIAKPFLPQELVFRVNKLFQSVPIVESSDVLSVSTYTIDLTKRIVLDKGKRVDLTSREFDIILFFIENKNQALSREQLLTGVFGDDYFGNTRAIDNYIKNIRHKLPLLPIETIYGYGYRYNL